MRVIAGSRRSLPLKTVEGLDTRPTTDRIKETLFNILMPDIPDCVFWDLFSGSGGIGIEALSRGARRAVFVENNINAFKCITDNIKFTKFTDESEMLYHLSDLQERSMQTLSSWIRLTARDLRRRSSIRFQRKSFQMKTA